MVNRYQLDRLDLVTDARDLLIIANAEMSQRDVASPTSALIPGMEVGPEGSILSREDSLQ